MEKKGQINLYVEYRQDPNSVLGSLRATIKGRGQPVGPQRKIYTINLAHGVTPFIVHFGGIECASTAYTFPPTDRANAQACFFRPSRGVFEQQDDQYRKHILQAGLVPNSLTDGIRFSHLEDVIEDAMNYEQVQVCMLAMYGQRLPALSPDRPPSVEKTDGRRRQEEAPEEDRPAPAG